MLYMKDLIPGLLSMLQKSVAEMTVSMFQSSFFNVHYQRITCPRGWQVRQHKSFVAWRKHVWGLEFFVFLDRNGFADWLLFSFSRGWVQSAKITSAVYQKYSWRSQWPHSVNLQKAFWLTPMLSLSAKTLCRADQESGGWMWMDCSQTTDGQFLDENSGNESTFFSVA